jgi:hypothetical protein
VTVLGPVREIRFVDVAGSSTNLQAIVTDIYQAVPVYLEAFKDSIFCATCRDSVTLTSGNTHLEFLASPSGPPLTSIRLVGGKTEVWVESNVPVDSTRITAQSDSAPKPAVRSPVTVLGPVREIRFVDAAGSSTNLQAIVTDVYQAVPVYLEAFKDSIFCATYRDSVTLTSGNTHLEFLASPSGPPLTSIRLVGGKAEVWVESNVPVDSTRITAQSDSAPKPAVRSPVTVLAPTLVFLDSTGQILTKLPVLDMPMGGRTTIRMELLTSTGAVCSACSDSLALAASTNRLQFLDTSGQPVTNVFLQDGKATFQLTGWAPVQSKSFSATTYTLQAGATWTPVDIDLGPITGTLMDSNADGKADLLRLTLPVDASAFKTVLVSWPDTNGVLRTHAASTPASGSNLTIGLPPFEFGATSCPVAGCTNLGQMEIVHGADTALVPFPVMDGVNPIPTLAQYRFSATGLSPDTLVVHFSEMVNHSSAAMAPWVSTGRPGVDSLGKALTPLSPGWLANGDKQAFFLVDSTNVIRTGDSLRISAKPSGALSDTSGNTPDRLAWWTPIVWGQPPPMLTLNLPHPVVQLGNVSAQPGKSPVTVLIHPDLAHPADWTSVPGSAGSGSLDTAHLSGVVVYLNRIPEKLGIYVYDNMGVLVVRQEMPSLADLVSTGVIQRDRRGNYELWLTWNGKDNQGHDAATGVYLIRVFGWLKDGTRLYFLNEIKTAGIHRTLPK